MRGGFFIDNEFRNYPFVPESMGYPGEEEAFSVSTSYSASYSANSISGRCLPFSAIVDCGFFVGPMFEYAMDRHKIALTQIMRTGDIFEFTFSLLWDLLLPCEFVVKFHRNLADSEFLLEDAEAEASEPEGPEWRGDKPWWGYLVTGRLDELAELLADGDVWTGEAQVEPALVQALYGGFASSFWIGNDIPPRATAPDGCPGLVYADDTLHADARLNLGRTLAGAVAFMTGYNSNLSQSASDNSIQIGAEVGAGRGDACNDEVARFPAQEAPSGRQRLDGAIDCSEVFRTINGIGGRTISFIAGNGIRIDFFPAESRIEITADLHNIVVGA